MTSRGRVEAALGHCEPDRTPVFEYVLLSPLADVVLGRPYVVDERHWGDAVASMGWERAVRQRAIDSLDLAQCLGHDLVYVLPNPMPPVRGSGSGNGNRACVLDDPVVAVRMRNARAREESLPSEDTMLVYGLLKEEMSDRGLDLPILAPAYAHGIWTDTDLMRTMLLAPEVAAEHFAIATERCFALIDAYAAFGVDQVGVGGDFAGNRPLVSPEFYRKFIMPEVRRTVAHAHSRGLRAVNASDGNLWSVIEDFLLGTGVDGYIEIDRFAGMDLARLKREYGDRVTFYGNMDCGNTLSFGSPEVIRAETVRCIEDGLGSGGHIFCASNAITASVSLENYLAMVNAYRDFFGLSRLVLP